MKHLFLLAGLTVLVGCGDPLSSLDRISDVELAETDPVAQAVPSEAEVAREGFFGTDAARPGRSSVVGEVEPVAPRRGGLFGILRRSAPPAPDSTDPAPTAEGDANQSAAGAADGVKLAALPEKTAPRQGGLFGLLGPRDSAGPAASGPVESDLPEVDYGTVIPYGQIARSCAARGKSLGHKIENGPARGYKLFDTGPGTKGLRTFYITGFPDRCPRQITAANVLLASPSIYEQLHYGPTGRHLPSGETDAAYERVKRRICGKSKGRPCGGKIGEMDRTTFFITSYPRLGGTPRWSEMLIHKGEVMAAGFKGAS
ncbi:MAG: hypothetical protein HKN30_07970 [Sulfitobacter sp.]|nr:hypothetical protein [Sulfitobacter sp.]